ncbi:GM25360 [Drosophila sechellia]|uniref:GM25360 n=1 Tax=Drosophila sechellia TaxID=7238 RepID=B4HG46_DROSE|nr:GM25360 [Drosophila sechellia]
MMLLATLCLLMPVAFCPGPWSLVLVPGSLVLSPWSMQGLALMFRQDDELYLTSMCLGGGPPPPPPPSVLTCVYPATFDATQTTKVGEQIHTCACAPKNHPAIRAPTQPTPTLASDESRTWICLFYCQNIKVNSRRCRRTGLIVIRGRCRQRCTYARVENRWSDHAGYFVLLATFGLTP